MEEEKKIEEEVVNSASSKKKSSNTGKRRKKPKASVASDTAVVKENVEESKEVITEAVVETKEEVFNTPEIKDEKVEIIEKKKDISSKKCFLKKKNILILAAAAVVILIAIIIIMKLRGTNGEITKVDKVLGEDYYNISCLDTQCNQVAAYSGDSTKESTVVLLDKDGNKVAKYSYTYNADEKVSKTPIALGRDWFIFKKTDNETKKAVGYSIADKKGNEVYSTELELSVLTKDLVLMNDTSKGINGYTILDPTGKILYKNVNDVDVFADNVVSIEENSTKRILDTKGNSKVENFSISNAIYDEDNEELLFLIAKDYKNNGYYYFDKEKLEIVGEGFQNYVNNYDGTLTISKKKNNKVVKYTLYKDGKQEELGESLTQSEIVSELKKEIDTSTYNIYTTSVNDKNQKYVFVDNIVEKSFGLYEIDSKKYTAIYSYKGDASGYYSSIYALNNTNKVNYYQISCSSYSCDKSLFYVYDLDNGEEKYKQDSDDLTITNYYQYDDGYKVVKYAYSSVNEEYRGKYVLFDKENKVLAAANNRIAVVDKKQIIGNEATSSIVLYSVGEGKALNADTNLASRISVNDKKYYKYSTEENTILVNEDGKEVLKVASKLDIIYSSKVLVYIDGNTVNIFNGSNAKTKTYTLKSNEKLNDASGDLLPPYRGALFINNSTDKNIKVVNSSGKVIKNIKGAEIEKLYYNSDENVVIISKSINGNDIRYGLYIAK